MYNGSGVEFEPFSDMPGLPKLYQNAAKTFGLLHLQGSELFFALDGQHRLKGIDTAISGKNHKGELIEEFEPDRGLANDDLSVILVPYEPAKRSRKIFNKVNEYAKQTSKGDNIVTAEDDAFAIIARWLMGSGGRPPVVKQELVNWKSNTLTDTQNMFTTISVLYEASKALLDAHEINAQIRPSDAKLESLYEEVKGFWATLLKDFKLYKQAVTIANRHGMGLDDFVKGLNKIPWEIDNEMWLNVLTLPGSKVLAGKTTVYLAARVIAHLVGTKLPKDEHNQLLADYRKAHGDASNSKPLPKPVA